MFRDAILATLISFAVGLPLAARACDLALVLAVDVSGSVDNSEYSLQMQGLAHALLDPDVSKALVDSQAAVMVIQWTGQSRQEVTLPWTRLKSLQDIETLSRQIAQAPRRWRNFSTAIGEALQFSAAQFLDVADCDKRVIDISGDGSSNEGVKPEGQHSTLSGMGVTVNALVIEGAEPMIVEYFWQNVIQGPGAFVITSESYTDYPARMKLKLLREVSKQVSAVSIDSEN